MHEVSCRRQHAGTLVEALTASGHEDFSAHIVPRTPDIALIEKSGHERRVVITFDKDFGELVFKYGHSVGVPIRLRETSVQDSVSMTMDLVNGEGENLHRLFRVIENTRIRKTPLP